MLRDYRLTGPYLVGVVPASSFLYTSVLGMVVIEEEDIFGKPTDIRIGFDEVIVNQLWVQGVPAKPLSSASASFQRNKPDQAGD
jgi:hypothetical protein